MPICKFCPHNATFASHRRIYDKTKMSISILKFPSRWITAQITFIDFTFPYVDIAHEKAAKRKAKKEMEEERSRLMAAGALML